MGGFSRGENFVHSFKFSPCSVRMLELKVREQNKFPCLANEAKRAKALEKYAEFFPGQVYTLGDQCKRSSFGVNSIPE